MKSKVIVGMSGGVDSSVAAYLLKEQGYLVEGLFMKNWEQDDNDTFCSAAADLADAEAVCKQLGIKLHSVNFSKEYWDNVFTHFLDEYDKSRTPNPDVLCNKEIKFKAFLDYALTLGADFIATGHYAKIVINNGVHALYKPKDRDKDQTYFLNAINKSSLTKTLFPLGEILKSEVREIAKEIGLVTHAKKDSTGICFIGEKRFKTFLNEFMLTKPGNMQTTDGISLGKHDGLMFYTLGQRQGLNIGGTKQGKDEPWYVVDKNIETNTLIVAQGKNHPMLYSQGLICSEIHWLIDDDLQQLPYTCCAKTRYRQEDQACVISPADTNSQHCVMFCSPQRAVTPGQYIVFYDKNKCLGGAIIEQIIR
ncbi:MAG: tRNA 2-thiouridine(34) synthase MnmA [Legionellaceae bacterium]|nr:tRNA 2-thiouridine(34) synthase MnmA [Legionellaceae bacterium]